ncbi:MAG TPA: transglycosylase SLT domain-containing protein [Terracidiphilus sp.]|nr:transglycosylase SLT domain-containing protein [Terracidiphilus sp.]
MLNRLLAGLLAAALAVMPAAAQTDKTPAQHSPGTSKTKAHTSKATPRTSAKKTNPKARRSTRKGHHATSRHRRLTGRRRHRRPSARARRIHRAFVASTQLRPMAEQLATMRTEAAYNGVTRYANEHTGEAAATAYLALGHAYLEDKKYPDAIRSLKLARKKGNLLDDYAVYLEAEASHAAGDDQTAEALLHGFAQHYPDSIFAAEAPQLEATVLLALNKPGDARKVLEEARGGPEATDPGFALAEGQVALALNETDAAMGIFKKLLLEHPLTAEAAQVRTLLKAQGAAGELTVDELRGLGDAYYHAHRWSAASDEYHALANESSLPEEARNGFAVAAAECDLHLKRLTVDEAEALPDSNDENGARRMYLLMELARNRDDESTQQSIVTSMESRFPASQWLAKALFSSGNMYLLKRDYPKAVEYYGYLAAHFPHDDEADVAHWRAAWLIYRQGKFADAARMFDEQLTLFPDSAETAAALYWRGRLYESLDHDTAHAAANYRAIVRTYDHYFYAQMARDRLKALGNPEPAADASLARFKTPDAPELDESFPDDSVHLAKAKLLANAGLTEYIPDEIAADPDSGSWSALAQAQIYFDDGETARAMRVLKRTIPYSAMPIDAIPLVYWRILYPEPYWETIKRESEKNNLDPYLVASLIRQESEFNPSVISYANAYGLMQLLPRVGRELARKEGMRNFRTYQLLNPEINIRLGTLYLRQRLDLFGGVTEYALAAYNAGDSRVADWKSAGPYSGMDEFVESIPFTQTREYVEAILRNMETYREVDEAAAKKSATEARREPQTSPPGGDSH